MNITQRTNLRWKISTVSSHFVTCINSVMKHKVPQNQPDDIHKTKSFIPAKFIL